MNRVHHLFSRRQPAAPIAFFDQIPMNNAAVLLATVQLGSAELRIGHVTTHAESSFPAQYHLGGPEIALVLQGQGCIEVLNEWYTPTSRWYYQQPLYQVSLELGDLILIPEQVLYQVHNTSSTSPLEALVCFPDQVCSFWPNGTSADQKEVIS